MKRTQNNKKVNHIFNHYKLKFNFTLFLSNMNDIWRKNNNNKVEYLYKMNQIFWIIIIN